MGRGRRRCISLQETNREEEKLDLAKAREWRAKRFEAGFGYISGAKKFGGRGLGRSYERAFSELENQFEIPAQNFFTIGLGMVAPTIADHADPSLAAELLPKMYRGDIVACQLFSEPGAGSDLASLQMKADRDGDEWIITGQKVWTSGAHYSDIGEVICRTDPDMPKHRGLTGFVVNMQRSERRDSTTPPDDRRSCVQRSFLRRGPRAPTHTDSEMSTTAGGLH